MKIRARSEGWVRLVGGRLGLFSDEDEREAMLSGFFEAFVDREQRASVFVLSRPRESLSALIALYRLPRLTANLTVSVEGAAIRHGLSRSVSGRTVLHSATAVLALPEDAASYSVGASKQTLRRKIRAARKLGVHWREIADSAERSDLLQRAHDSEREHQQEAYRIEDPANFDLLNYGLWLVAYSADDRPLLLCVAPIDGEWALLRYFRTLGAGQEFSDARYLMTEVLVEQLVAAGVRYLADSKSPFNLTNGLRHFQRMLGYRTFRVDIVDGAEEQIGTLRRGAEALASRLTRR